jgi:hypothetical protein
MIMFPLLCRLFANNEDNQKRGTLFFETANESILEQFKKMRNQKESQYAALVLCMLKKNQLTETDIPNYVEQMRTIFDVTNAYCIEKSLQELTGTYVVKNSGVYSFSHNCLFQAIANLHAQEFPEQLLESLESSYIANNVHLTSETEGNLCICLESRHYESLARRLLKDIKDVKFNDVFGGNILKNEDFLNFFISHLDKMSTDDLEGLFLNANFSDSAFLQYSETELKRIEICGIEYYPQNLPDGEMITYRVVKENEKGKKKYQVMLILTRKYLL